MIILSILLYIIYRVVKKKLENVTLDDVVRMDKHAEFKQGDWSDSCGSNKKSRRVVGLYVNSDQLINKYFKEIK